MEKWLLVSLFLTMAVIPIFAAGDGNAYLSPNSFVAGEVRDTNNNITTTPIIKVICESTNCSKYPVGVPTFFKFNSFPFDSIAAD